MVMLKEDSLKLGARTSMILERCWENIQRTWQAEAHMRTILFAGRNPLAGLLLPGRQAEDG